MNPQVYVKISQKTVKIYYEDLKSYETLSFGNELAIRSAFQNLLKETAKKRGWTLITELRMKVAGLPIIPDGTLNDEFNLPRGYWEAKDTNDDLEAEIQKKLDKGYPKSNIIFEDSKTGILYQDGTLTYRADLTKPDQLVELLNTFFSHTEPAIDTFEKAVVEFKKIVPDLAKGLTEIISRAHTNNPAFIKAFNSFFELCKSSLNPNISQAAVDEMLVQHLLTERLIRTVFDNPEFTKRNVIAQEIEKVIDALVSKSFNRQEFLKSLDRFYFAIEEAARSLTEFSDKQHFLNTIYERFFQGYSVKLADTHGIVYTPQPIVDFMCASVVEVLRSEFGKELWDKDVYIIDPCTGTGNFIVNLMRRIPTRYLKDVYTSRLFANEVMLMPYYISALNIEHAYYERMGEYESFEGLCFVDTLDMVERPQTSFGFMSAKNAERVERQKKSPITVVIGNPPYNVGQLNENDNNKNREYKILDARIKDTYSRDSKASLRNKLYDPYVKFFRWATDRLAGRDGIVCLVTNNSFIDQIAFDGMRKHLEHDFSRIYHVDLHGNVRQNPKLSGTTHNVFGIQVGVGITVAVKSTQDKPKAIKYYRVNENWRKEEKYQWLIENESIAGVGWVEIKPDIQKTWLALEDEEEFSSFPSICSKEAKSGSTGDGNVLIKLFSLGVSTNRDSIVYDWDLIGLAYRIKEFVENYNQELDRFIRAERKGTVRVDPIKFLDEFLSYDQVEWSEGLKRALLRHKEASFDESNLRKSIYRPFVKKLLFFNELLNDRRGQFPRIFPTPATESENRVICVSAVGNAKSFHCLISNNIPDLHLTGDSQCFPFYTYKEDGTGKTENITEWALQEFWKKYPGQKITKWDIFYYIYGILHHPGYRAKYGDNLKRDLPRIPYAPDFAAFRDAGKSLAKWHLEYESVEPYSLNFIETKGKSLSYAVEDKMRLSQDKTKLTVNPSLTLAGIPPECYEYRLGNRSALEWVIDQYQIKTGKRSGILSDPNRQDDPEYIVRLVGQVIKVSLETVKIVNNLPSDFGG